LAFGQHLTDENSCGSFRYFPLTLTLEKAGAASRSNGDNGLRST